MKPEVKFENDVRARLSQIWQMQFAKQNLVLPGSDPNRPQEYDLVSPDRLHIGDVKWFAHDRDPGAKIQEVEAKIWLLQIAKRTLQPERVFLVTNKAGKAVIEKAVKSRYRLQVEPVEFYYFDDTPTDIHQF